jgi:gluconolactonase
MTDIREITSGLAFPEGPIAFPDGSVLVVEIRGGRLTRVGPDGAKRTVAEPGGGPNGAAIGPDGKCYVCNNGGFEWHDLGGITLPGNEPSNYSGGRIERIDLDTGAVEVLYRACDGHPLRGPNDLVFAADGSFWFTDHGKIRPRERDRGGIYWARPDGSEIREVVYPLDAPNGIGLSPDGRRLYAAETFTGRVWAWDVVGPGAVASGAGLGPSGATLLAGLPGYQLLDSLAVDSAGWVCVATIANGGVTAIAPDGSSLEHVPLPDPLTTNLCFGGPELRTAYATLSGTGRLVSFSWPRPGLALAFQPR